MVVQKTKFVLHFYSMSVSGAFSMVDYITFLLMCRCPIVLLIYFSRCFFIKTSTKPLLVLSKPSFIYLRRLVVVGLKSAEWRYCVSSGLVV